MSNHPEIEISSQQLTGLSEQLLLQVKMEEEVSDITTRLASLPLDHCMAALDTDLRKNAFWINLYNAFFLILRKQKKLEKPVIYTSKEINIAGKYFSLDDIEHGILRRYRFKWSLGYLPDPFASSLIRQLAVSELDWRIHFALNCGARSCPPIAFYTPAQLDQQLDLAATAFLEGETEVLREKKEIHISRLFLWYLGDFGGRKGIRQILKKYLKADTHRMKLVFKDYDWTEDLNNFV